MKTRLLLTTVFAIMLFAVTGSAQQRLIMFDSHSVSYPMSTSRAGAPMAEALEGKPVRVVIHFAKSGKSMPNLLVAPVKEKTFKIIPCGAGEPVVAKNSAARMEVYLEFELSNTLISSYSISGHSGSCGLLGIRLANGTDHFARLRFVTRPVAR